MLSIPIKHGDESIDVGKTRSCRLKPQQWRICRCWFGSEAKIGPEKSASHGDEPITSVVHEDFCGVYPPDVDHFPGNHGFSFAWWCLASGIVMGTRWIRVCSLASHSPREHGMTVEQVRYVQTAKVRNITKYISKHHQEELVICLFHQSVYDTYILVSGWWW